MCDRHAALGEVRAVRIFSISASSGGEMRLDLLGLLQDRGRIVVGRLGAGGGGLHVLADDDDRQQRYWTLPQNVRPRLRPTQVLVTCPGQTIAP